MYSLSERYTNTTCVCHNINECKRVHLRVNKRFLRLYCIRRSEGEVFSLTKLWNIAEWISFLQTSAAVSADGQAARKTGCVRKKSLNNRERKQVWECTRVLSEFYQCRAAPIPKAVKEKFCNNAHGCGCFPMIYIVTRFDSIRLAVSIPFLCLSENTRPRSVGK